MNQQRQLTTVDDDATGLLPAGYEQGNQSLAVSLAMAEIDQQITTAHAYPRSVDRAVRNILALATLDDETAKECIYALPRGKKPIRGPSIRLAEIIQSQWGNNRTGTRVVHIDRVEKYVEAEGIYHDLEMNTASTARVRRRISDSEGRLYSDDMIIVTGNAASSIAKRNAILGGVPKAVWRKAYAAVEAVLIGDAMTMAEKRDDAMKHFAAFGVKPEQIFAALEITGLDDIGPDQYMTLVGMHQALRNNEATVEEMFSGTAAIPSRPRPKAPPPPAGKDAKKPADRTDDTEGGTTAALDAPAAGKDNAESSGAAPSPGDGGPGNKAAAAGAPPESAPAQEAPAAQFTRQTAIDVLMKVATDPQVEPHGRLENLDLTGPMWIDKLGDEAFVKTVMQTAAKVVRGELKEKAARDYLESLGKS